MGAALGVNWVAVEDRFKAVIWLDGGFFNAKPLPGADQADFAPRVKAPTLMIAGKFDWIFLGKDALLQMLGTPAGDKKAVTFDTMMSRRSGPTSSAMWLPRLIRSLGRS